MIKNLICRLIHQYREYRMNNPQQFATLSRYMAGCFMEFLPFSSSFFNMVYSQWNNTNTNASKSTAAKPGRKKQLADPITHHNSEKTTESINIIKQQVKDNINIHLLTGIGQLIVFLILAIKTHNIQDSIGELVQQAPEIEQLLQSVQYRVPIGSETYNRLLIILHSIFLRQLDFLSLVISFFTQLASDIFYLIGHLIIFFFFFNNVKYYFSEKEERISFILLGVSVLVSLLMYSISGFSPAMVMRTILFLFLRFAHRINQVLDEQFPVLKTTTAKIIIGLSIFSTFLVSMILSLSYNKIYSALIYNLLIPLCTILLVFFFARYVMGFFYYIGHHIFSIDIFNTNRIRSNEGDVDLMNAFPILILSQVLHMCSVAIMEPVSKMYVWALVGIISSYLVVRRLKRLYLQLPYKKQVDLSLLISLVSTLLFGIVWFTNIRFEINKPLAYLIVGASNGIAIIPGFSRMMTTFMSGLFLGLSLKELAIVNFFLSAVASIGQWLVTNPNSYCSIMEEEQTPGGKLYENFLLLRKKLWEKIMNSIYMLAPKDSLYKNLGLLFLFIGISAIFTISFYFIISKPWFWHSMIIARVIMIVYFYYNYPAQSN